jgi:hypothetical protein
VTAQAKPWDELRMKWWKYALVVIALTSWLATLLLDLISSYADWPLIYISAACLFALSFFTVAALVRRRWRELAIVSLPVVVIVLPVLGVTTPAHCLRVVGFRIYASPIESYRSGCTLHEFVDDDGTKQQVGQCHSVRQMFGDHITVIYDTTGQFVLPVERRTAAWQSAVMWHLSAGTFLARNNDGRSRIFGNFYAVYVPLAREDG